MEKCFTPTVILLMLFLNERVIALGGGGRNEDDTHHHHDTHRLGLGGVNFILFLASFRIFATES